MNVLDCWDWKYKVYLQDDIKADVTTFIAMLAPNEKAIYEQLMRYYESFFSLDILLDALNGDDNDKQLIQVAQNHLDDALKIPTILNTYFEEKINNHAVLDEEMKFALHDMLQQLLDNSSYKNTEVIQRVIFGDYFHDILLELELIEDTIKYESDLLEIDDVKEKVDDIIAEILKDCTIVTKFGPYLLDVYDIAIENKVGFAEWWDKDLAKNDRDLLVLFNNQDALNKLDFEHTIYHEVYPGHGQYYNFARKNAQTISAFDHGAMSLLEGWATFCEWNVKHNDYAKTLRNRAKRFLKVALTHPNDNADITMLYNEYRKIGYSKEQTLNVILYLTQYPGFLESYYLGALCIEIMLKKGFIQQPIDLLRYLEDKTWGELFALWR